MTNMFNFLYFFRAVVAEFEKTIAQLQSESPTEDTCSTCIKICAFSPFIIKRKKRFRLDEKGEGC